MIRWTPQKHEAMIPEAEEYSMDVYQLLHTRYEARVTYYHTDIEFFHILQFYDPKRESMFMLRYGHLI